MAAVTKMGYDRTTTEHTSEGALAAYDRLGHDIAVLDLRHPKLLDGVDLCRYAFTFCILHVRTYLIKHIRRSFNECA